MELDFYKPCAEWYARADHIHDIHGIAHAARVLVWANQIANWLTAQGTAINLQAVRWAAALHDIRRYANGYDLEHGNRAAQWVKENHALLPYKFSQTELQITQYCCVWHVPPDNVAPKMTPELTCLKDADGLDRVRLYDLNIEYLRTAYAKTLDKKAFDLYKLSEFYNRKLDDHWDGVRRAALEMDLWH